MPESKTEVQYECVDTRPFECPNGCGQLEVGTKTSVWCPDCNYARQVLEYTGNNDE